LQGEGFLGWHKNWFDEEVFLAVLGGRLSTKKNLSGPTHKRVWSKDTEVFPQGAQHRQNRLRVFRGLDILFIS
jgi:hypothetical protein